MNKDQASISLAFHPLRDGMVSVKLRVAITRENRPKLAFPVKDGVILSKSDFHKLVA